MAASAKPDSSLDQRANLNIAAAVVTRLGAGASDSMIANVINDVRASHPVSELASAGSMSGVLSAVDTAIARATEVNRPINLTDSRAAQLATQSGPTGGHGQSDGTALGRYGALLGGRGNRTPTSDNGEESGSAGGGSNRTGSTPAASGTGSEPLGSPFWSTAKGMLLTRSYANDNDMNWAPSDLMRMGRPALQALKESGLKGDGYQSLRQPSGLHFDNTTIVAGAGYMRRNGCNYNEAAKSSAEVDRLAMPKDMRERHRAAVKGVLTSKPEDQERRREELRKSGDEIVAHDPAHKKAVEQERRHYKAEQSAAPKAEVAAKKDQAASIKDDADAKKKADVAAKKDVTASNAHDQAKSRRAAAQANFGAL